ncbi:MAG TPA: AglZ/HisF2 family acetamidino modification protein [Burkholderiales bacterium]|nr:AglZ/HisF2 family acetamidino modification protein [Burkholderiales bacterium]
MLLPRIIPCLLVKNNGLVKTVKFGSPKYVGDPINAVRIFNEKEVDELMVLDIDASAQGREPDYGLIGKLAAECRMPLCYGGGVKTVAQVEKIVSLGVEKVAISSAAVERPALVSDMAGVVGSQSVVAVLDAKRKGGSGEPEIWTHNGTRATGREPAEFARELQSLGVGEIVVNSIDNDGVMKGYDLTLVRAIMDGVTVPLTALGGAGSLKHLEELIAACGIVGAAAGSLFVFKGVYRAVLINYPARADKDALIAGAAPR